jgi:uncharacterized protein YecT (DUF1311 family)
MRSAFAPFAAALVVASLLGWLPSPAQAADAETIAACLKSERGAGRDGRQCIGRVSDPCLEQPGGQTTVGMVECTDRETKVWDDLLNAEYKRLLGVLGDKAQASVRAAERAWIAARDADCSVPYDIFEGGTIAQPIAASCILSHTAMRALQLRNWRDMAQPEDQ